MVSSGGGRNAAEAQEVVTRSDVAVKLVHAGHLDTSRPLLSYSEARTMLITHPIEAVQINSPQWAAC